MRQILGNIEAAVLRCRYAVIGTWLVVIAAAVPFALNESDHLTSGGFVIGGSQSAKAEAGLARYFPQVSRADLAVLLWPQRGADGAELSAAVRRVRRAVRGIPDLTVSERDVRSVLFVAGLEEPLVLPLKVNGNNDRAQDIAETLRGRLGLNDRPTGHVEIHLLGEGALSAGLEDTFKADLIKAELIGFPLLFAVLLLTFGSFAAATLPVLLGGVAVLVTGAIIYFLSLAMEMSVFVTNTVSMLGIGVAVDYSLMVLGRVRQELDAGRALDEACLIAIKTSGRAVAFSGIAVVTSLVGLWVIPSSALHSMALGAIVVVSVSVLISLTFLPATIGVMGIRRVRGGLLRRVASGYRRRTLRQRAMSWDRWTLAVTKRPMWLIFIPGSVLLFLGVPALMMRTSTGPLRELSDKNETRIGFNEAAKLVGPGALGPIFVVVHASKPDAAGLRESVTQLRSVAIRLHGVHQVGPPEVARNQHDANFTVIPSSDPESPAAERLVQDLRKASRLVIRGTGTSVTVGGTSATQVDVEHAVAGSIWKALVVILMIAFVVLTLMLRSVVLALMTVVLNVLSVGAAYGVLVIVFQWGWLNFALRYHSLGHLDTLTPPLIMAVVFGLSMDYQVFLLSRIREQWVATGDAHAAVAKGLAGSARMISSAAVILVCAFGVFAGTGTVSIRELGLGAAVAIAIDATLIRLILVPAIMELLGEWSWWRPRLLRRRTAGRSNAQQPTMPEST